MKLENPFDGKCKHGVTKREGCQKCFDKMTKDSRKRTEKFLKDLAEAEKLGRKCKLQFD